MLVLVHLFLAILALSESTEEICEDKSSNCPNIKYLCKCPLRRKQFMEECPVTCRLCLAKGICQDMRSDCPERKSLCKFAAHVHQMKTDCPLTCGHCVPKGYTTPKVPTCRDLPGNDCAAIKHLCPKKSASIQRVCPLTCGFCTPEGATAAPTTAAPVTTTAAPVPTTTKGTTVAPTTAAPVTTTAAPVPTTTKSVCDLVRMPRYLRDMILDEHNKLRSRVAKGEIAGPPGASNMYKLSWDCELEKQAFKRGNCADYRATHKDDENLYFEWEKTTIVPRDRLVTNGVRVWSEEISRPVLEENNWVFTDAIAGGRATNVTKMIWGRSTLMGCAAITWCRRQGVNSGMISCLYQESGNKVNEVIFEKGTACKNDEECTAHKPSKCEVETGLCVLQN